MPMLSPPFSLFPYTLPCPSLSYEGPAIDFIIVSSFFDHGYSVPYYLEIACLEFLFVLILSLDFFLIRLKEIEISYDRFYISCFRSLIKDIWCLIT